jgi:branched-chain amino acid aminotransferase
MPLFNFNGQLYPDGALVIDITNNAFRQGEGLIETMYWNGRTVKLWELHYKRLISGMNILFPETAAPGEAALLSAIQQTVNANPLLITGKVRLQVSVSPGKEIPDLLVEYAALPAPAGELQRGLRIGMATNAIKCADALSALKTTSRLNYIVAAREARQHNLDDVLLYNQHGRIAESTIANIFWIRDQEINTPPLAEGCVAGILRQHLLTQKQINGLPVREQVLEKATLSGADEIFLANALRGIQPVRMFMEHIYPVTTATIIADHIHNLLRQ